MIPTAALSSRKRRVLHASATTQRKLRKRGDQPRSDGGRKDQGRNRGKTRTPSDRAGSLTAPAFAALPHFQTTSFFFARMSFAHLRTTRASFLMTNGSNLCQPDKRIRRRRRRRDTSSKWAAAAGVGCLIRTRSSRTAMVLTRSTPSPAAPTRIYNKDPRRSGSRRAVSTAWVQLFAASRPDTAKQATSAARVQTAGNGWLWSGVRNNCFPAFF